MSPGYVYIVFDYNLCISFALPLMGLLCQFLLSLLLTLLIQFEFEFEFDVIPCSLLQY